jgi:hypothetical protein
MLLFSVTSLTVYNIFVYCSCLIFVIMTRKAHSLNVTSCQFVPNCLVSALSIYRATSNKTAIFDYMIIFIFWIIYCGCDQYRKIWEGEKEISTIFIMERKTKIKVV